MSWWTDLLGTFSATFGIGKANLDASGLSAARTFTLPDADGQVALGAGVPAGGSTGQVLNKQSGTDFDLAWVDPSSGPAGAAGNLWFLYSSDPNGYVSANAAGDLCLNVTNGDIYQASAAGAYSWGSPIANLKGPTGTAGNLWFTQSGNPNGYVSANAAGDLCLDTTTGDIYQASAAGTSSWGSAISNIKGAGVPSGGATGQILAKIDTTDYNTQWVDRFPVLAPDGSPSAPSYSFGSDTDTGWYYDPDFGVPKLKLAVGGSDAIVIDLSTGGLTVNLGGTFSVGCGVVLFTASGSAITLGATNSTLAFFGGTPASKQGMAAFGSLSFSDPPTQAECNALRDMCTALQNCLTAYTLIDVT